MQVLICKNICTVKQTIYKTSMEKITGIGGTSGYNPSAG